MHLITLVNKVYFYRAVFIVGGTSQNDQCTALKTAIDELLSNRNQPHAGNSTSVYDQILDQIKCNAIGLNAGTKNPEKTGEAYVDVVIDDPRKDGERVVVVTQRVQRFDASDVLIGILVLAVNANNRWFWINPSILTADDDDGKWSYDQ